MPYGVLTSSPDRITIRTWREFLLARPVSDRDPETWTKRVGSLYIKGACTCVRSGIELFSEAAF